jgi:transposase InsO family protein
LERDYAAAIAGGPMTMRCASDWKCWLSSVGGSAIGDFVLLRREGRIVNGKRVYRLYKQERLIVRRRGGRKRAIGVRSPMPLHLKPNQRWSLDSVHEQITDGRRLGILAVVDDYTRECLALVADTSISGIRVARELDKIVAVRVRPGGIISDNGTEVTSSARSWLGLWFPVAETRGARQRDYETCRAFVRVPSRSQS